MPAEALGHRIPLGTTGAVGQSNGDVAIETTGALERAVEHVRAVGGRDDNHAIVALEAVHLNQQLVQGLLTLVVAALMAGGTLATNGVDFVDEDDGRRLGAGLGKCIAHTRGAHAHEHFYEVRTGGEEKRDLGFTGHSLGQQRFARARGAFEQDAVGHLSTHADEAIGRLEEVDDLLDGCHRVICMAGPVNLTGFTHHKESVVIIKNLNTCGNIICKCQIISTCIYRIRY